MIRRQQYDATRVKRHFELTSVLMIALAIGWTTQSSVLVLAQGSTAPPQTTPFGGQTAVFDPNAGGGIITFTDSNGNTVTQFITFAQAQTILGGSGFGVCYNKISPVCACSTGGGSLLPTLSAGTKVCFLPFHTLKCFIDNYTLNHHHFATDYVADHAASGGCSSCGGGQQQNPGDSLLSLEFGRRHRYREIHWRTGSFGPGVFSNFDIQLMFDGGATLNDPGGLNLNYLGDTNADGVYNMTSFQSGGWDDMQFNEEQVTFSRGLRFLDENGNQLPAPSVENGWAPPYAATTTAIFESHSGHRFIFETGNGDTACLETERNADGTERGHSMFADTAFAGRRNVAETSKSKSLARSRLFWNVSMGHDLRLKRFEHRKV